MGTDPPPSPSRCLPGQGGPSPPSPRGQCSAPSCWASPPPPRSARGQGFAEAGEDGGQAHRSSHFPAPRLAANPWGSLKGGVKNGKKGFGIAADFFEFPQDFLLKIIVFLFFFGCVWLSAGRLCVLRKPLLGARLAGHPHRPRHPRHRHLAPTSPHPTAK